DLRAIGDRCSQSGRGGAPYRAVDSGQFVAQAEVDVAAGIALDAGQFTAHPDRTEAVLDPTLEGTGKLLNRPGVLGIAHRRPDCSSAACRVLRSTIAIVIGPTPPGTGV